MRKVELVKGIYSSVLGFGCAPVLGSVGAKKAKMAIECALANGINDFDLARSYGYGEAEKFVGNIIKSKRDQLVLASKFGIKANWKSKLLRPAKPLVRFIQKNKKNAKVNTDNNINTRANLSDPFHDRIQLRGKEMRKSLEQSLSALSTDYLDYYFIHEPLQRIEYIEELSAEAECLKEEGKIRAWGLAFMRNQEVFHQSYLNNFDLLQFDNSPGAIGYDQTVTERGDSPNVIFSPLRGGSSLMSPADKIQELVQSFPRSVILCSMYNDLHIRENVDAVSKI